MNSNRNLMYSGLIGVAVLWVSVATSLFITRFDVLGTLPISYLGTYESSKFMFNGGLLVTSILFSFFMLRLRNYERLSKTFLVIFLLGQLSQIIVAITPYNGAPMIRFIHVVSAFTLAFALPASMYFFKKTNSLSDNVKNISSYFLKAELLLFLIGIGWFVTASRAGALAEITTAVAFDIWIIWLSILYSRESKKLSA